MNLSIEPLSTQHFGGTRLALAPAKVPKCLAREDFGDNPWPTCATPPEHRSSEHTMATAKSIDTGDYKLFPSPRNVHRVVFEHQVFVPYPYALIVMDEFYFKGATACFPPAASATGRWGQVATFELASDVDIFNRKFTPIEPALLQREPVALRLGALAHHVQCALHGGRAGHERLAAPAGCWRSAASLACEPSMPEWFDSSTSMR
jgi:hypothetical protein